MFRHIHLQQSGIQLSAQWQLRQQWNAASQYAEFTKHLLMYFRLQQSLGDIRHSLHIKHEYWERRTNSILWFPPKTSAVFSFLVEVR